MELNYAVYYVDEQGNELQGKKVIGNGNKAIVIEHAPVIPGYSPTTIQQSLMLSFGIKENAITFVYAANASEDYDVEYYYMDTGTGQYKGTPDDSITVSGPIGLKVEAKDRPRTGYELDESNSDTWGYISTAGSGLVLRVYYRRTEANWTIYHYRYGTNRELAASETGTLWFGDTKTATEAQINGYTLYESNPSNKQIVMQVDPDLNVIILYYRPTGGLAVGKSSDSTYAAVGDVITYTVTVTNTSVEKITGVLVKDPLMGADWDIGTLEAGGSVSKSYQHTVTEADAKAGAVHNTAVAEGTNEKGDPEEDGDEKVVTVKALLVEKTADKDRAKLGEVITYTVRVTNVSEQTISGVRVSDPLMGAEDPWEIGTLEAGGSVSKSYLYTVTEADAKAGAVHNTAVAEGTNEKGDPEEDGDEKVVKVKALLVEKTADKDRAKFGEVITYTVKVTNVSEQTISGIKVSDPLMGAEDPWEIGTLEAGGSVSKSYQYTVTEADAKAGAVHNTAVAAGTNEKGDPEDDGDEKVVTVKVDPDKTGKTTDNGGGAKTGDNSNIIVWIALLAASAICAVITFIYFRKRQA